MLKNQTKKSRGPARTGFRGGFTLVEMMVAIAVFSIVMVTAMSALLNVIDANNKAKAIKTTINNISFALEGISKDMRMGTNYTCGSNEGEIVNDDCPNGGNIIRYRSVRADEESVGGLRKYAYYKFDDENYQILSCLEKDGLDCSNSDVNFEPITSREVKLTKVVFYILNDDISTLDVKEQPRMIMTVKGVAGKGKITTEFDLQTGVSQVSR